MKIFLSHSSRQKPLIREVKRYLPTHISAWVDEKEILVGDSIDESLKDAIETASDYVVLFVDEYSAKSNWVRSEVEWALDQEEKFKRTIVLPVIIDKLAWEEFECPKLKNRKYLKCYDFNENTIKNLSSELISELFSILSREIESSKKRRVKDDTFKILDDADSFLKEIAEKIRFLSFAHRRENPLSLPCLKESLDENKLIQRLEIDQFENLIVRLIDRSYLSGIIYDGNDIFIEEEHFSWKKSMFQELKKKVANKAVSLINSGDIVALDSGSTTLEVANALIRGLKLQVISDIKVVTNSIAASKVLVDTLSELGVRENNSFLKVYLTGGFVRPNTQAIVGFSDSESNTKMGFEEIFNEVGCPDLAFLGVNGIDLDHGFSTHKNKEIYTKLEIIKFSRNTYLLADHSKFGIKDEFAFQTFDDRIKIIADETDVTLEYQERSKNREAEIILC